MNFIGHDLIRSQFKKAINNNTLSHAHLIIGVDGIGKSLLAKEFAINILGKNIYRDYIDIVNYKIDKSSFGVDEVRSIIDEVNKKPFEGDKKVIIINKGNKLTVQAQNTLLKTIEEPPKGVYIIILCENSEVILETIKSRCQIHKLTPLHLNEMKEFIELHFGDVDKEIKNTLISFSQGIPGKVKKFLKEENFMQIREVIIELLRDINIRNENLVIKYESILLDKNKEIETVLETLMYFVRDIMVFKEVENKELIINKDKIEKISELSNMMSYKKLKKVIEVIDKTRFNIKSNINTTITLDVMLIELLEG